MLEVSIDSELNMNSFVMLRKAYDLAEKYLGTCYLFLIFLVINPVAKKIGRIRFFTFLSIDG